MREIRYYIADDGKQFDDEFDCQKYEMKLKEGAHKHTLRYYDVDGSPAEAFDECCIVVVTTMSDAQLLDEICEFNGWYAPWNNSRFIDTMRSGIFYYDNDEWYDFEHLDNWVCTIKGAIKRDERGE